MKFEHTETNLARENEYPKLVRDRIPDIIRENDGKDVPVRVLELDAEFLQYLQKKVAEEAEELAQAGTDSNLQEEIADVLELVHTIMSLKGWSAGEFKALQTEKRRQRGGFEKRLLMLNNVDN